MSGTVRRTECAGLGELGTRVEGLVGFGGLSGLRRNGRGAGGLQRVGRGSSGLR